jgi:hypothetical protein
LWQASDKKDDLCPGSYFSAELKTFLICCQRSGVIVKGVASKLFSFTPGFSPVERHFNSSEPF